ncbi:hypothetical protein BJ322DRAFT_1118878 [Thelephora terrestris]|uniref:LIM zinc-binding domain-containing protein n=1 Tax=Thelephora terrestris TaxID=56493 RepID=A0A9P6LBI7_9AGAM|nr:hypothetical protein BJ322DRAFT_1118878 [Thelephora terrestris]
MASLLPPPTLAEGRISQVLPTVKCSDCSRPVPIHELGEHVCPPPPSPSTPGPSLSNLLAQRVQEMVSSTSARSKLSKTPPPKTPSPAPSLASRQAEVSARRSRALSVSSRKKSSPSPGPISISIPPMKPVPTEPLPKPKSPISPRTPDSVPPHHIPFPTSRSNTPNISVSPSQIRAPSVASNRSASSHPSIGTRDRGLSNASQLRPSFDSNRSRKSSNDTTSPSTGRPPYDIPRTMTPSDNSRPNASYNQPPPIPSSIPPSVYTPSLQPPGSDIHRIPSPQNNSRPRTNGLVPSSSTPPLMITEQPMFRQMPEPDTKIGGEAGMAGVGRRGFHAAARAAIFTTHTMHLVGRPSPGFLDIQKAIGTHTPPLSPSGNSPNSPYSAHSPIDINSESERSLTPRSNPSIASPTFPPATPTLSQFPPVQDKLPDADYGLLHTPVDEIRSPLARDSDPIATVVKLEDNSRDKGPRSSDGSAFGGLAYADSESDYDDLYDAPKKDRVQFPALSPRTSRSSGSAYSPRIPIRSLSAASSSHSGYGARSTARSVGALDKAMETLFEDAPLSPTTNASFSPLSPTRPIFPTGAENHSSVRDSSSKPPKLPTRSHTSPTIAKHRELDVLKPSKSVTSNSSASSNRSRRVKQCASCDKIVDDGRWIPMDGGKVLCDKCWKNMYLPKCRRCDLPIEKHAVSSSDGQLKGKYHRDCFNCHSCQKPFPDKTFYVHDGQPYCDYHYHEVNGSLCAASSCGQPIEGPCAVAHSGAKYHPEHFTCEFPRCTLPLDEYYEADGKMFCERHASIAEQVALHEDSDQDSDEDGAVLRQETPKLTTMAMKRTTRFIDIAGLGVR